MLKDDIRKIIKSPLSYTEKSAKLSDLLSKMNASEIMQAVQPEKVELKEPLRPKREGMKTLTLSIHKVYLDQIIAGTKPIEFRDWTNDYYKRKCSYEENGQRYLVPFDALVLYVGRGKNALTATVALKDIKCNGKYLMFFLGDVLYSNSPLWHKG